MLKRIIYLRKINFPILKQKYERKISYLIMMNIICIN